MTDHPVFVDEPVCQTCHMRLSSHLITANLRIRKEYDYTYDGEDEYNPPQATINDVTYLDCIFAIREALSGPQGYTGAMGMRGLPGRDYDEGAP